MRKLLTSFCVFVFAFLIMSASSVSAKIITNDKGTVTISKSETVNDDLFIAAQNLTIDGTVNGDVFAGAQIVKISGVINGNLHIAANSFDLDGTVRGNVYTGAQNITISGGKIGGSLIFGTAMANIDKTSVIGGSLIAGVGSLTFDGQVKRSGYVGTGSLTLGDQAKIGNDLYYATSNNQANISSKAKIGGSVYKTETKNPQDDPNLQAAKKNMPAFMNGFKFGSELISFIGALIIGYLYFKIFGKHFEKTASLIPSSFWKTFGIGFLVSVAAIPVLIILLITIIGIPVAGVAILVFMLVNYLAKLVVGLALGKWITQKFNWKMSTFAVFALGLFVIYVARMIPVIGFITGFAVLWIGRGALVLGTYPKSE